MEEDRRSDAQRVFDETPLAGGPPVAPDASWWSGVDHAHRSWIVVAIVAAVVLLAAGVGFAVALIGSSVTAGGGQRAVLTPAVETSASDEPTLPASAVSGAATSSASATATPTLAGGRAALVAYRMNGAIWIADESGAGAKLVFASAQGPFALSPDGTTLAVVDASSGALSLVDVAGHPSVIVGPAVPEKPGWSPDSSFLVFTSQPNGQHDTVLERVSRDGSGRRVLGPGSLGRVAPDGSVVGVSASRSASGTPMVLYAPGGVTRLLGRDVAVDAVAPVPARVVFADAGGSAIQHGSRQPSLQSISYGGAGQKTLVAKPSSPVGAFFGDIVASPDGRWIAYTETGDDGYSRLFAVRSTGGKPVVLSVRRDDYILGWNAAGGAIFFIEGNAIQQEPTRLMVIRPDGTQRRIVVDGAGL